MDDRTLAYRRALLGEFPYLPLFYLIPGEFLAKRKLDNYPRDPMTFATEPHWKAVYDSKHFQVQLTDIWAWMMWQTFGIRGGFDSYSIHHPFVRIAVDLPIWMALASVLGMTTDVLAALPEGTELPFPSTQDAARNCGVLAKKLWSFSDLNLAEILEVIEAHRSHADYSNRRSHVKTDFYRHYYHTRSKWVNMEPLEEDHGDTVTYRPPPNELAELERQMWLDSFCEQLNEKDAKILRLLDQKYTQQEIADLLGYANHSGVNKRINKHIAPAMRKYKIEESEALNRP